jgi:hypothetical protein
VQTAHRFVCLDDETTELGGGRGVGCDGLGIVVIVGGR